MKNKRNTTFTITIFFSYLLLFISLPSYADLTYQDFGNLPDVASMGLSPDGNKVYAKVRMNVGNKSGTAIEVTSLETNEKKTVLYTDNTKYDINWIVWKNSNLLLVGIIYPEKRDITVGYGQKSIKVKTRETRLMVINTETNTISSAFSKGFLKRFKDIPTQQDHVIDFLPNDDNHILIALKTNKSKFEPFTLGVYKLNIKTQKAINIEKGFVGVSSWKTDQQHNVRLVKQVEGDKQLIKIKDVDKSNWRTLWEFKLFSEQEIRPMGFAQDPNILYVRAYHKGKLAIFSVNIQDEHLTPKLIFSNEKYDIKDNLIYSQRNREVIGVRFSQKAGYHYFNKEYQSLQKSINKAMPKTNNRIISVSQDENKYIVFANSDNDSGTYLLGTRKPSSLKSIAFSYEKLVPNLMSSVKEYNYTARDGLEIEAFLTIPNSNNTKNLPTIIFPHGGPISRDTDSFNVWSQYLAYKGYAVLQMNFRGSDGQGIDFLKAGLKNWGLQMQDDIQDGALQLIKDGIADKDKICILGASYGGYAALMGAVKTPDFYRCAVSIAGVSNVVTLVQDNRAFWRSYNVVDEQIGTDREHLKSISPVNQAEKFKIPVLLIHGDSDRQVDIKHSQQMRDELLSAKKNVTYIELQNEDHYLTDNKNRLKTFAAIEQFLTTHLPAPTD